MINSMEKTYVYRMYPNEAQRAKIQQTFGAVRFVFNHYMNLCKECYLQNRPVLTYFDMVNDLSRLKKEHSWLKAVDSRALQNSLKLLRDTGKKYYGKTMDVLTVHYKRKNSPVTRYKSTCNNNSIAVLGDVIKLPKLKKVRIENTLPPVEGRILHATIIQKPDDSYYVYVCCTDVPDDPLPATGNSITLSAEVIENLPQLKMYFKRYERLQASLSRSEKGSHNFKKTEEKLLKLKHRIYNLQRDYYQKLSTDIVRKHDVIKVTKNGRDPEWIRFCHMLYYKSNKHQRNFSII
ncbi:MAG: RNA-guided endonuclease TnpB family protein [Selenomonadaceae bacterium]|nr:RNA-guided endonuclease TnpB family protein [Selenomonadaceae bacterium]